MSNAIVINNVEYLLYEAVDKIAPMFCRGSQRMQMLIDRYNIDDNNHSYVKKGTSKWELLNGKHRAGPYIKHVIKKSFIDSLPEVSARQVNQSIENSQVVNKVVNRDEPQYINTPDIIKLEDNEKFKDADGNVIEIETRGERKHDKIYFRVKDVATGFGMDVNNLHDTITKNSRDGYQEDIHYRYLMRCFPDNDRKNTDKKLYKRELFLTYLGILRVLFVSRAKHAERFAKWTAETLFTIQMGTKHQKRELVSSILGVDAQSIKHVFDTNANEFPSIYLFSLGYVRELRASMTINEKYEDDSIVFKYGFTKDLKRRTAEHLKTFGDIPGAELRLKYYAYVDPQYLSRAEVHIKDTISNMNGADFKYNNMEELFIVSKKSLGFIEEQYGLISSKYMGHSAGLITQMKEMEAQHLRDLTEERHKYELLQREIERIRTESELAVANMKSTHLLEVTQLKNTNELIIKDYENKLLNKELENMRIRLEYFERKS